MSDRARIDRLLLLNWRGFFFQPFELHEAVTALEGENGAGKTTVMIAAFVALLPDLQRLVFRNIGEGEGGGDGDRGIHGRLGAKGPSYTMLDLRTGDGVRVVAGVCLLRGAPPALEFKRFVVEGLPADSDLDALVLMRDGALERIPELGELRESFARAGATLRSHDTVGRYCGHLHELGILPMRMEQPQDRQRYYQMLHTSMYGGFSSSLQKGLRDYLLNEDQRLRNHVARMRENLDACRITRRRIAEADQRYRLIAEVFRFGWGLAEAAFHGTRLLAESRRTGADQAREGHRRARAAVGEAQRERERLTARHLELRQTLERLAESDREAVALLERCQLARRLRVKRDALAPRRAEEARALTRAQSDCDRAQGQAQAAGERHRREQLERDELADNLGEAQKAFESISRKVGQYRAALTSLAEARAALPDRQVEPEALDALIAECECARKRALGMQSAARQELEGAELRRRRFDALLAVLGRLLGGPVTDRDAAATARLVDAEHRGLEHRVAGAQDLPERIRTAESRARDQAGLRERLNSLVPVCGPLERSGEVRQAHAAQASRRQALQDAQTDLRERCAEHRSLGALAGERAQTLERDLSAWGEAQAQAEALREPGDRPIDSPAALDALRAELADADRTLTGAIDRHAEQRRSLIEEAERLEFGGGRLDESLVGLADRLDGQLLAELFDAVPAAEAASAEARLGPLHAAVLVPDVAAAAAVAVAQERRPEHLWLVPIDSPTGLPPGEALGDSELVQMGEVWRLSRRPQRPVVGRVAREREIERLRAQAQALDSARYGLQQERERVHARIGLAERLAVGARWLDLPSPEPELRAQRRIQAESAQQLRTDQSALDESRRESQAVADACTALDDCLAESALLDEEDWSVTQRQLRRDLKDVQAIRARLERSRPDIEALREGFMDLEQPPPDAERLDGLRTRLAEAEQVLDYWGKGRELLHDLAARRPHFAYAVQESLLAEQQEALGSLQERLRFLAERVAALQVEKDQAERAWDGARNALNDADARLKATQATDAELLRQLTETGEDGTAETLAEAERLRAETARELTLIGEQERQIHADLAVAQERVGQAVLAQSEARELRRKAILELRPHWRNWVALRVEAARLGLLARLRAAADRYQSLGPPNVMELASERRGQLGEALKGADGGPELKARLEQGRAAPQSEGGVGLRDLRTWMLVRGFLEQSIPRDIVQSDDPEVALVQIGQHLGLLRERLTDQEQGLRQSTEDIAHSIQVRIRREETRIGRLNRGLGRVRFGSIQGVRIHMERQPLMLKLLDAMRTQPDLFEQDSPLEDALAAMYRHIGGGQIQGDQLIDYRQYVRIGVQVQRLGRDAWADARAGALSTGESIGVGAAVLVVILDAWEQQAALLKGRKAGQALRFLFLDEANRLSPESLDTLTELCEQMQVQLLVAAPAADRARRGHIYRLVRRTDSMHEEEVVVRGRRMRDALP